MLALERASHLCVFAAVGDNGIGCSDAGLEIGLWYQNDKIDHIRTVVLTA